MTTILRALQALSDKWRSDALVELCYYADALVACADELDTFLATHDMGEMVLVPREPTPAMLCAGFLSESERFDIETPSDAPGLVYRAMIAAYTPPASEERRVDAKPEHAALEDDVVDAEFWPDRGDQQ